MMTAFRRWAVDLLNQLLGEEEPSPAEAPSAPAEALPAPAGHDASPVGEPAAEAPAQIEPLLAQDAPVQANDKPIRGCPACRAVVISDRAYSAICAEVLYRHPDETGGVFLGQVQDGVWYVVEATDPGLETLHTSVHHEMDDKYLNHVYRTMSRMYREGLDLLGLWHRHPGSYDRFSANDMETNADYARVIGSGAISMLVNIDPGIRLTCRYCELMPDGRVRPVRVPVLVGDRHFAGTGFLIPLYPDARIQPVLEKPAVHPDLSA